MANVAFFTLKSVEINRGIRELLEKSSIMLDDNVDGVLYYPDGNSYLIKSILRIAFIRSV